MLWKGVKNLLRVGLPVYAIKYTHDQGVWDGSTVKSSLLYERVKEFVVPGCIEYPKQLPTYEQAKSWSLEMWNYCIQKVFYGVESLPHVACETVSKVKSKLN